METANFITSIFWEGKTMNNRNVAHAWAHQHKARATGSNFYFEGDTIYSYGRHFPIARIDVDRGIVWFTTRGYSNTTAKHISLARQAIPSVYTVAYVDSVDSPERSFMIYRDEALGLLERRRTEKWTRDVGTFLANLGAFFNATNAMKYDAETVSLKMRESVADAANRLSAARDEYLEAYAANSAKREADAKKRAEKAREKMAEKVAEFHAGEVGPSTEFKKVLGTDLLRVYRGEVQTSQGVTFGVADAKTFWMHLGHIIRGALDFDARAEGFELKFGDFRLNRIVGGTIYAGCHKIERAEVMRFAASLGLNTDPDPTPEYAGGSDHE